MLTTKEITKLSPEEFSEKWKTGEIQDSALKLLGVRPMTDEDRKHVEDAE